MKVKFADRIGPKRGVLGSIKKNKEELKGKNAR
jgi:hypothetical protein